MNELSHHDFVSSHYVQFNERQKSGACLLKGKYRLHVSMFSKGHSVIKTMHTK